MRPRKILLLLVILMSGAGIEGAWFVRQNLPLGPAGCRGGGSRFYGPSFSFDAEERREMPAPGTVELENAFGGVRVVRGELPEVKIHLRKVVYQPTEEAARAFAGQVELRVEEAGGLLRLATNRGELESRHPRVGFETHFEVAVPSGTAVVVRNEHGRIDVTDVARAEVSGSFEPLRLARVGGAAQVSLRHGDAHVSGVAGPLTLAARHGNVEVQDVEGETRVEVEHGEARLARVGRLVLQAAHGSVHVETVRGDLEVRGQHAAVTASDVSGTAQVETSFRGVEVERVGGLARLRTEHGRVRAAQMGGAVVAESSFDDVTLADVAGPVEVRVSHGGVHASDLRRGARITASGDDILLERVAGAVEVENERGDVEVMPAAAITEPLSVRTRFGDIRLHVPQGSRMALQAATPRGELTVDVPGLTLTREAGGRASGRLGDGGNEVRLFADHGSVEVTVSLLRRASLP